MTDKELLELAAKAAGIEVYAVYPSGTVLRHSQDHEGWNPLTDDGDALRLSVKLGLVVQSVCYDDYDKLFASAWKYNEDAIEICSVREVYTKDPYAATRRAIVRAAAEIGKNVP